MKGIEHKQQAAVLLARADEIPLETPFATRGEDRRQEAMNAKWELRFEAMIHAVLYLGDALAHNRITIDQR